MKKSLFRIFTGCVLTLFFAARPVPAAECSSCTTWSGGTVSLRIESPAGSMVIPNVPWFGTTPTSDAQYPVSLAMKNAQCVNSEFRYTLSEFCPYGSFVDSINGTSPATNQYWELFINEISATAGIDTQILNENDIIEWKIESYSPEKSDKQRVSHQLIMYKLHKAKKKTQE